MIWTASSSQFSRSPGELPELDSQPLVLGLEPGATDPEDRAAVADVVERGDLLRHLTAGLRNVFAPTISPMVARSVASAQAAMVM